eukprot:161246-Karenia_brevis.AAC.1
MAMGTGRAYGRLDLGASAATLKPKLYMSKADVKKYFYSLLNVPDLQKYFCLPPVPIWLLQSLGVCGVPATSDGWVWPMLLVVPMGWSWAFWIGQR